MYIDQEGLAWLRFGDA